MIVCNFQCLQNFLLNFDVSFIQPFVCSLCIQLIFSGRDNGFFLCSCRIFVVYFVKFDYVVSRICLNNIRANFAVFQCTENFHYLIRIITGRCCSLIFVIRFLF